MNILITGIHGFVGSNLVAALKEQHTIYGLDIVSPPKDGVVQTFLWSDLNNIPFIDIVIHLAGKAHDTRNQTNSQVYFDINTGLTKKIFDWFLTSKASKFIFFSSAKAVADSVGYDILTEDWIPSPKGPYGESKLAAENYILRHLPCSMPHAISPIPQSPCSMPQAPCKVYILRPCMIHGPGNKGNLNLLYKIVSKGIPWPLGFFENKRSFTSIGNLQFIIKQLVEENILEGTYNIADDKPLSTNELIRLISATRSRETYKAAP